MTVQLSAEGHDSGAPTPHEPATMPRLFVLGRLTAYPELEMTKLCRHSVPAPAPLFTLSSTGGIPELVGRSRQRALAFQSPL